MAAVGIFAAGMAHEVKNPLAIIVQGIGYLKSSVLPSDPVSSDIMERIKKSAMRADSIVKGLLSFTHQIPIQKEKMELISITEEALSCMEHQFNTNHITVLKQYPADVPTVYVDSSQIKQVFISIFTNSLEAMKDGGTITIRTQETKGTSGQHYVQIILSDTGCGIPEDVIEKVFDPFYTTKDSCGNAGLGLSISKGIVDKHQGMIRIESTVNQETHVTIELPANTEHGSFDTFKNMDSHVIASKA
jgi:two-component system NtrC family sensor kinase